MFVYWEQRSHPISVLTDTSPMSALPASIGYGSSDASGAHWTWTRPQHWSTHSYRRVSTIATFCWQVRRKWSLTGCNSYCMLLLVWSPVLTCIYERGLSRLLYSELHWLDVPERVQYKLGIAIHSCLHGQSPRYLSDLCVPCPTSRHGSIFDPLLGVLVVPRCRLSTLVHGPSLWPARRFGTLYQTA